MNWASTQEAEDPERKDSESALTGLLYVLWATAVVEYMRWDGGRKARNERRNIVLRRFERDGVRFSPNFCQARCGSGDVGGAWEGEWGVGSGERVFSWVVEKGGGVVVLRWIERGLKED